MSNDIDNPNLSELERQARAHDLKRRRWRRARAMSSVRRVGTTLAWQLKEDIRRGLARYVAHLEAELALLGSDPVFESLRRLLRGRLEIAQARLEDTPPDEPA